MQTEDFYRLCTEKDMHSDRKKIVPSQQYSYFTNFSIQFSILLKVSFHTLGKTPLESKGENREESSLVSFRSSRASAQTPKSVQFAGLAKTATPLGTCRSWPRPLASVAPHRDFGTCHRDFKNKPSLKYFCTQSDR